MKKEIEIVKNAEKLDGLRVIQNLEEVIETLKEGETIARFEFGDSMMPIFESGQYARLTRLKELPQIGDAVFCCVNGYWMTHMVWMCNRASGQCLIGSTSGEIYGWTDEILALATPMPYKEVDDEAV